MLRSSLVLRSFKTLHRKDCLAEAPATSKYRDSLSANDGKLPEFIDKIDKKENSENIIKLRPKRVVRKVNLVM